MVTASVPTKKQQQLGQAWREDYDNFLTNPAGTVGPSQRKTMESQSASAKRRDSQIADAGGYQSYLDSGAYETSGSNKIWQPGSYQTQEEWIAAGRPSQYRSGSASSVGQTDTAGNTIDGDYYDSEMEAKSGSNARWQPEAQYSGVPEGADTSSYKFIPVTPRRGKDFSEQWMRDSYEDMVKDGGKWAGQFQGGMLDMLDSGNYDAFKDWYSYGGQIGEDMFMSKYGDEYADLLKDVDMWSEENGWNDDIMRQIFDSEISANPTYYERMYEGGQDAWGDILGNPNYELLGDYILDYVTPMGFGNWEGFTPTSKETQADELIDWLSGLSAQGYTEDEINDIYTIARASNAFWNQDAAQGTSPDKSGTTAGSAIDTADQIAGDLGFKVTPADVFGMGV